jgi:hypothetical protein
MVFFLVSCIYKKLTFWGKRRSGFCAQNTHFYSPIVLQSGSFDGAQNSAQKMLVYIIDENDLLTLPKVKKRKSRKNPKGYHSVILVDF